MWTDKHRAAHGQSGPGFPSDLTDAEWERLEPLIPPAKPGGRPRETDMRQAMNAIFYLLRTGCPWRYLPRDGFPPRSTEPRRWVVERTFSWLGRNRRLAKDYENLANTLAAFVAIASIRLALKRIARLA